MEAGILWREEMQALHDAEFRDVERTHMPADNCAMQLVREPAQFDVIVTERSPARAHGSKRGGRRSISGIVPFYLEPPSSTLRIFDRAQTPVPAFWDTGGGGSLPVRRRPDH